MTPELQQEMSVLLSPPFIAGFITWLVTQIAMIVFMIRHKPRNRKVEEAVRRGHAVKAYIVGRVYKEYNSPEESVKERQIYRCDYEYVVNGKKMRYRYHAYTMPPSPLTLYYIDDPKKVFPGEAQVCGHIHHTARAWSPCGTRTGWDLRMLMDLQFY